MLARLITSPPPIFWDQPIGVAITAPHLSNWLLRVPYRRSSSVQAASEDHLWTIGAVLTRKSKQFTATKTINQIHCSSKQPSETLPPPNGLPTCHPVNTWRWKTKPCCPTQLRTLSRSRPSTVLPRKCRCWTRKTPLITVIWSKTWWPLITSSTWRGSSSARLTPKSKSISDYRSIIRKIARCMSVTKRTSTSLRGTEWHRRRTSITKEKSLMSSEIAWESKRITTCRCWMLSRRSSLCKRWMIVRLRERMTL